MRAFDSMRISTSGLAAERLRMDVIASNMANVSTTRGENGKPYVRKIAVFKENYKTEINRRTGKKANELLGVKAVKIVEDKSPLRNVYEPEHPDADENGYVTMPNVNPLNEMADLISSSRAYEANVTCISVQKNILSKTLEIGR